MKEIICGMCGNQNAVTNCWYQSDSGVQERTPVCGMCPRMSHSYNHTKKYTHF